MIQQLNIPDNGVVDTSLLATEVGNDAINTAVVPVPI